MGVIKRQSVKQGLVSYVGIIIGAISTIFVYPLLGKEKYGEIQFVISMAAFFVPILGIGLPSVAIHFFPNFKEDKIKRGRFLFVLLAATFFSLLFFLSLILLFSNSVSLIFPANAQVFIKDLKYILPITFCFVFIVLLQSYISNFNRIVIPSILYDLFLKIIQPLLVLLFVFGLIAFHHILSGLVIAYFCILFFILYYLKHLGFFEINLNKLNTSWVLKRKIIDYSFFSILITASNTIALQMDKILIGLMLGNGSLGIFSIPVLITEAIDVIRKSIARVASPIVSDSLKSNDLINVNTIYKKSAMLQFTIGMLMLIVAWVCADNLYQLMPNGKEFAEGKVIILILGLARLIDMLTGVNTEIIAFSNYYRANLYMLLILVIVNIFSNYLLIPIYGINGAALATLISMFFFNFFKLLYIYSKLKIHPFDLKMISAILIGLITLGIALLIPDFFIDKIGLKASLVLTIAIKSIIISIFYFLLIWKFKISEDITKIIDGGINKILQM